MPAARPFLFSAPRFYPDRPIILPAHRDPEANIELRLALFERGLDFGESILNFPDTERACYDLLPRDRLRSLDVPSLGPGDVLVQTTRPPLNDGTHFDRKKVEPGNTDIERAIFEAFWRYFEVCSRSFVKLTPEAARYLPAGKENRTQMDFFQTRPDYRFLQAPDEKRSVRRPLGPRTAAWLLRVDALWDGGPGAVVAFGMNSIVTLAWCRLLRRRYTGLLDNRGLTMVELMPRAVPHVPATHDWSSDWHAEPVFETQVELPPRRQARPAMQPRAAVAL